MKAYGGSRGVVPFVPSALGGGEWSTSHPGLFTPDKEPLTHCIGGWMGTSGVLDDLKNRKTSWLCQDSSPGSSSP